MKHLNKLWSRLSSNKHTNCLQAQVAHANGQPTLNIHLMNDNFVIAMRSGNESSTVRINRDCACGLGYRKLTVIRLPRPNNIKYQYMYALIAL